MRVEGDGGKLEQVFLNLLKNAIEADAEEVQVRFRVFCGHLIVALDDNGHGCGASDLARIAEPFFSGKAGRGGSGLGCSIAEAILRSHGATLRAYSKNLLRDGSSGLVLNLVFPLAEGSDPSPAGPEVLVAATAEARA